MEAGQFLQSAEAIATVLDDEEIADGYATLCVHAGIAAADVITCTRLGVHAQGQNHQEARGLLARVDASAVASLEVLLAMRTRAGYSTDLMYEKDVKRAGRAAAALVALAREC